ncbi:LOW QUALITY PROTEIN: hypothetical protein OSB04_un001449 [Centaurea solstitialis]|uniref:Uncharacterized protein n=1 Tax=Centaurea solstitialis TaxID=347529 RepID=A0AA38S409_9ASTR|nr:LOW QUALITY PROTEIN: hypothetical protein OSB04_un001449 [Centaurea solstitialis]
MATKHELRSLRDLTTTPYGTSNDSHAPPVSAFPKAPSLSRGFRGMSSPGKGGILNALATALHGSIRTAPSIHRLRLGLLAFVSQCQCRPSRVLSPLVFFPISTHFTAPPEIPSAPTTLYAQSFRITLASLYYRGCWHRVSRCLFPNTFMTRGPSTSTRHCSVSFRPLRKIPHAASRSSLGRVSVPVWLIILSDQLLDHRLGKLLPHQLLIRREPLLGRILLLLLTYGVLAPFPAVVPLPRQVLTRYSPVRHWKHHFPSDLHVLSMPPAFILSQDRTLHEIHSCITYSFLVHKADSELSFIPRPNLYPCASYLPGVRSQNIAIPAPSRQSHEPLSISFNHAGQRVEKLNDTILEQLGAGLLFLSLSLSEIGLTTDSSHSTWFHKTTRFSRSKSSSVFYSIRVGEEPDPRKQNQVKMIRINPFFCAKDLTISEGTEFHLFSISIKSFLCEHIQDSHYKKDNGNPTINYFIYEIHSNRDTCPTETEFVTCYPLT